MATTPATAIRHSTFDIVFADKKTNLAGLQLADLVARPVGLNHIRPAQANQAFDLLKAKFFCAADSRVPWQRVLRPPIRGFSKGLTNPGFAQRLLFFPLKTKTCELIS